MVAPPPPLPFSFGTQQRAAALTINNGTIALGDYSQRDGWPQLNTTAGLIINGRTVTATSVHVSTNNSWSNVP